MYYTKRKLAMFLFLSLSVTVLGYQAYQHQPRLVILQDFGSSHTQQYAEENQALLQQTAKKVVVIGDSIVYGWKFPAQINGYLIANRGIDGQTTDDVMARFTNDALNIKPQYVVILVGINDIATIYADDRNSVNQESQKIIRNIQSIAAKAKKAEISPIVCSVLPVNNSYNLYAQDINKVVIQLNNRLEAIAHEEGIIYLDLFSAVVDPNTGMLQSDFANDGLHPNEKGYQQMWPLLSARLI